MIGGRVLDPGAVAALLDGSMYLSSWLSIARTESIVLFVPELVYTEVTGLREHQEALLGILVDHPQFIVDSLNRAEAAAVETLMANRQVWDATAAAVVYAARRRGWQIIAADPGRLTRIDPDVDLDIL